MKRPREFVFYWFFLVTHKWFVLFVVFLCSKISHTIFLSLIGRVVIKPLLYLSSIMFTKSFSIKFCFCQYHFNINCYILISHIIIFIFFFFFFFVCVLNICLFHFKSFYIIYLYFFFGFVSNPSSVLVVRLLLEGRKKR